MKYLKYILGILAILVFGSLLLGIVKPRVSYESEIMVEKPVAEPWAVVQDEEKMPEWLPGFQKIEHISGTPGTVGAVSDVCFENDGQQMTIRETITSLKPNESISMSYTSDFMDMDYQLAMTGTNGKTQIITSTTAVGNGVMSRSILVLMGNSLKAQEETNLNNLKKTIEQNTKNYAPLEQKPIEIDQD